MIPVSRETTFLEATLEAVREEMARDDRVFAIGEDSGVRGGSFPIFKGIAAEFGDHRLIGTPICEGATTNTALGAAMTGMRPIVGLHFADFMLRAMDEIGDQVARARYTFGGQCDVPMVIRAYDGVVNSAATQHSGAYEAIFAHFPGLKVVMPSTPADAKGLLKTAIRDDNPVIFLEHKRLLRTRGPVPDGEYLTPFGQAAVRREGTDVSIVGYGIMMAQALAAADRLADDGIDAEVIDLRTIVPLDTETLLDSVARTGRLVVTHESWRRSGFGAEVAAVVAEKGFADLRAPIMRVAGEDVPVPFSPVLEQRVIPNAEGIVAAAQSACAHG